MNITMLESCWQIMLQRANFFPLSCL